MLDGLIAAISVELFGDQRGEPRLVAIEDVDEFQQRAHPFGISGPPVAPWPAVGDQRLRTDSDTAINTPALASTAWTWAFKPDRIATSLAR